MADSQEQMKTVSEKKRRPNAGRETKLDAEMKKKIIGQVKRGIPNSIICLRVGITEKTLYDWKKRGEAYLEAIEKDEEPNKLDKKFSEFLKAFNTAEADFHDRHFKIIENESLVKKNPVYSRFLLKQRFRKEYSDDFDNESGADVTIKVTIKKNAPEDD